MTPISSIGQLGNFFLLVMAILAGIGVQAKAVEETPYKDVKASGIRPSDMS